MDINENAQSLDLDEIRQQQLNNRIVKRQQTEFQQFKRLEEKGLFNAYREACLRQTGEEVNIGELREHFAEFASGARKISLHKNVANFFYQSLLRGVVEFLENKGVIMVTLNGDPKAFCPQKEIDDWQKFGTPLQQQSSIPTNDQSRAVWQRGRFGYIPVECSQDFKDEFRKRSKGSFDNLR